MAWCIGLRCGQAFAGKLPKLQEVLPTRTSTKAAEAKAQLYQVASAYGLKVQKRKKKKTKRSD